jgi:hypothetical protein
MWVAALPLWAVAALCLISAGDIAKRADEIDAAGPPGKAGLSLIIALICSSLFACAGFFVWRL